MRLTTVTEDFGACVYVCISLPKLLNATIGVPIRYSCPPLLEGIERARCYATYGIATLIPTHVVDKVVTLVRHYPTTSVYNTHQDVTNERLIGLSQKWDINRGYKRLLAKATRGFPISLVIAVDLSLRIKRCGGTTRVTDKFETTRSLAWYQCNKIDDGNYHYVGSWFDISLAFEPTRLPFETLDDWEHKRREASGILHRTCAECGVGDNATQGYTFKVCSRCKKVYYCSKSCQRTSWKGGHKTTCGVLNVQHV